jgi:hypothetical protein
MIQTQVYTRAQAHARSISLEVLIQPLLDEGYRISSQTQDSVTLTRTVCPRRLR